MVAHPVSLGFGAVMWTKKFSESPTGLTESIWAHAKWLDVFFQNIISTVTFQGTSTNASRKHIFLQGFHKKEQRKACLM